MPMGDNDYQVDCADVPLKKNDRRHPSYWKSFNEMRAFHQGQEKQKSWISTIAASNF